MMKITASSVSVPGMIAVLLMAGCQRHPATQRVGPWDVQTVRTLNYSIDIISGFAGSSRTTGTTSLSLIFAGGGKVSISLGGKSLGSFTMTEQGRLTPDTPGVDVPAPIELLSV